MGVADELFCDESGSALCFLKADTLDRFRGSGKPVDEVGHARGRAGGRGVEEGARSLMSPIKSREGDAMEGWWWWSSSSSSERSMWKRSPRIAIFTRYPSVYTIDR